MSPYYYSLGMILLNEARTRQITQESVRLLIVRSMLADEENQ